MEKINEGESKNGQGWKYKQDKYFSVFEMKKDVNVQRYVIFIKLYYIYPWNLSCAMSMFFSSNFC